MANAKLNGWIWRIACLLIGVAFGAGGAVASINHLGGRVDDHETRIRAVEKTIATSFSRIETKLNEIIEKQK